MHAVLSQGGAEMKLLFVTFLNMILGQFIERKTLRLYNNPSRVS